MTSRLHRVRLAAERIERAHADRERVIDLIRRYEVGLLVEESVSADERIDVSREVHALPRRRLACWSWLPTQPPGGRPGSVQATAIEVSSRRSGVSSCSASPLSADRDRSLCCRR